MKVSCSQADLKRGLRAMLDSTPRVLLKTDSGRLKLSTIRPEMGISCWIDAVVEKDGAIVVPLRIFTRLVSLLPPGPVDMKLTASQTLGLSAGRNSANVKGTEASEFPILPLPEGSGGVAIEPDVLRTAIDQVAFAAATDESRPVLTGVLAKFEGTRLTLAATDAIRLSVRVLDLPSAVPDPFSVVIPARALTELKRISGGQEQPIIITVTPTRNQVLFQLPDVVLVSQLIDGNFPDYERIIPREHTTHAVVDTAAFLKACRTAHIFARDGDYITRLCVKSAAVSILATSYDGNGITELDADVEGPEIETVFNINYLIGAFSAIDTPKTALGMTTTAKPCVIRPVDGPDFTYIVMPMNAI